MDHAADALKYYAIQMEIYKAQVEAYKAEIDAAAIGMKGVPMARTDEELFTVYRAANGFYARMQGGGIVVGTTLSETCTAAQGQIADAIIQEELETGSDGYASGGKWKRV